MKIIVSVVLVALLAGCASINDFKADMADIENPQLLTPQAGADVASVARQAQDAHAGGLEEMSQRNISDLLWSSARISYSADYASFKFYQTGHMVAAKQQRYVKNPEIYVFNHGKFVLVAHEESLGKDMAPLVEREKAIALYGTDFDLADEVHTEFGVWPNTQTIAAFHAYGINSASDFAVAGGEFKKYARAYGNADITVYLRDRKIANDRHIPLERAMEIRKAADAKEAARKHTELLARLKKMRFTAMFVCSDHPSHLGWDWALAKDLLGAHMQHAYYVVGKLLTEGTSAQYCSQLTIPYRNYEALASRGTSFGVDRDGVEYFLVKDTGSTMGVIGRRK